MAQPLPTCNRDDLAAVDSAIVAAALLHYAAALESHAARQSAPGDAARFRDSARNAATLSRRFIIHPG